MRNSPTRNGPQNGARDIEKEALVRRRGQTSSRVNGRWAPRARNRQNTSAHDARALGGVLTHKAIQIAFPQRLWLAFSEWNLGEAHCNRRNKADRGPSLAPEGPLLGPEVQQSRDCEDARVYEQVEQANP
jgi:hypothetical protein